MKENVENLANEFAKALIQFSEFEGLIIRGHILVEQSLNRSIELSLLNSLDYESDRFSFSQKIIIGNMLGISGDLKVELNALNKLRNQIAHSLKYDENLVDVIIDQVRKRNSSIFEGKETRLLLLTTAISFLSGIIAASYKSANLKNSIHLLKKQL
jgi:hypothetical protein